MASSKLFLTATSQKKLFTLLQNGVKLAPPLRSSVILHWFTFPHASLLSCFVTPRALLLLLVLRYCFLCLDTTFSCIPIAWCFTTPLCFTIPLLTQIPFCPFLFCYSSLVAFLTSFISSLIYGQLFLGMSFKGRLALWFAKICIKLFPNESDFL
jgi:hypothetical protein